jgi:glutamine cyclotransferase
MATEQFDKINNENFEATKILKRNETYYTQGIFLDDKSEFLYESGGLYKESVIVKMEYPSLKVVKKIKLSPEYFGEGLARCGESVYQLTWQERKVIKYSFPELKYQDSLDLPREIGEGWGLSETYQKNELIASDGSQYIYFLNCEDGLKVTGKIRITFNGKPMHNINALAYVDNFIWANIYYDQRIIKINPTTGNVEKAYDMKPLIEHEKEQKTLTSFRLAQGDVLNGIAYDKVNKRFLLTGKKWGYYYEVNFKK